MDWKRFSRFIQEKMGETRLPGLSVAAVQGGEVVWHGAFGFRDLERGLPTTPATLYGIGSITKSFTALAVMQLAEEGKLSLDSPVREYIPEFELRPLGEEVRIRHLLTHSSGIPALAYAEALIRWVTEADGKWLPIGGQKDFLIFMSDAGDWAVARPGERWFYLNEGYALLGAVIEACSGLPYQDYVRRRILEPLGMERSFFRKEEVDADRDAAVPYIITREGKQLPSRYPYGPISSDGGLISNVLDLARYVLLYLGRGSFGGKRLLSQDSVEEMERPWIPLPYSGAFGKESYGYGLQITANFLGRKLVGHGGSVLVSTAYMGYIPDEDVGIVLLANGSGYPLSQLGMYGLSLLLGENPDVLPFVRNERALAELAGTYETYRGTMRVEVVWKGDFLFLEIRDRYTETVVPLIPEELGPEVARFLTLQRGRRLPVEFRRKGGTWELIYERYLLRKVSTFRV